MIDTSKVLKTLTYNGVEILLKGGAKIESVDDGNGGQILNITDAHGGTEITDGIVVKTRNADGSPAEIDYYGSTIQSYQFGFNGYGTRCNPFSLITKVDFKNAITTTNNSIFTNAVNLNTLDIPENVVFKIGIEFARNCTSLTTVNIHSACTVDGYQTFQNCTSLKSFLAPKITNINATGALNSAMFNGCTNLQIVQFGSVGYGVTRLTSIVFNNTQSNLTITIYTDGAYADMALANARNGATNATIVIKASEDTTYGGTSYAAGDTMITSEVA